MFFFNNEMIIHREGEFDTLCEEGEEEYDLSRYPHKNVYLEILDDPEAVTTERLIQLEKKHRIERVVLELNAEEISGKQGKELLNQ